MVLVQFRGLPSFFSVSVHGQCPQDGRASPCWKHGIPTDWAHLVHWFSEPVWYIGALKKMAFLMERKCRAVTKNLGHSSLRSAVTHNVTLAQPLPLSLLFFSLSPPGESDDHYGPSLEKWIYEHVFLILHASWQNLRGSLL